MEKLWKKLLYILGFWIYFLGEGITEAYTWMDYKNPDIYHLWRVVEWIGLGIVFGIL